MEIKKYALPRGERRNRILKAFWTMFVVFCCLAGCSSNSDTAEFEVTPEVIVEPNQKLSTAPHEFDVYRAANADKAVVFLHGAMGTKHIFARQLGVNLSNDYSVVNEQALLNNGVMAVFPQGQAVAEAPLTYTWSNYVMTSGQDDIRFIRDLLGFITAQYGITRFYLVGHSNGGMMANRIWCEDPDLFEGYISIAGPPSEHFLAPETTCTPVKIKPYLGIVGAQDNVLQVPGNWEAAAWSINPLLITSEESAFVDPVVIGERYFLPSRVAAGCNGIVKDGDADAVIDGKVAKWSFCNDSIMLVRVESGGHAVESLESAAGTSTLDLVFDFIF